MHGFEFALFIPILALIIPIVAILSTTMQKMYETKHERGRATDKRIIDKLQHRVEDLESRVLTLQDIVIAGDYEARRRIDRAMSSQTNLETPLPPEEERQRSASIKPNVHRVEG